MKGRSGTLDRSISGRLAQWLERSLHTREVRGSSPRLPTREQSVFSHRLSCSNHNRGLTVWRLTNGCAEVAERQTRYVQGVVPARACGFKSLLRHHYNDTVKVDWLRGQSFPFQGHFADILPTRHSSLLFHAVSEASCERRSLLRIRSIPLEGWVRLPQAIM